MPALCMHQPCPALGHRPSSGMVGVKGCGMAESEGASLWLALALPAKLLQRFRRGLANVRVFIAK